MATAKHEVFIGLQHENYYLKGTMKLWWGEFIRIFFRGGGGGKEQMLG